VSRKEQRDERDGMCGRERGEGEGVCLNGITADTDCGTDY
jgi:hypothetical protein